MPQKHATKHVTKRRRSAAVISGISGPPTMFPNKVPASISFTATKANRKLLVDAQRRERLSRSDILNLLIALHAATVAASQLTPTPAP